MYFLFDSGASLVVCANSFFVYSQILKIAMNRIILILLFSFSFSFGQIHEFGVFLGGANAIADVGSEYYINPNTFAIGGLYKWNRSPRHSYRVSAMYSNLRGSDSKSNESRRSIRDYSFKNEIKELTAGMEFTFWDFDLHDKHNYAVKTTPYLFTGLSYFNYKALALNTANEIESYDTHNSLAIPMVVGVKSAVTKQFIIGVEIGVRYTFTDDLDGSNPVKEKKDIESLKFGNINSNDWYVFSGITLTYTFGKNPCFCNTN